MQSAEAEPAMQAAVRIEAGAHAIECRGSPLPVEHDILVDEHGAALHFVRLYDSNQSSFWHYSPLHIFYACHTDTFSCGAERLPIWNPSWSIILLSILSCLGLPFLRRCAFITIAQIRLLHGSVRLWLRGDSGGRYLDRISFGFLVAQWKGDISK